MSQAPPAAHQMTRHRRRTPPSPLVASAVVPARVAGIIDGLWRVTLVSCLLACLLACCFVGLMLLLLGVCGVASCMGYYSRK